MKQKSVPIICAVALFAAACGTVLLVTGAGRYDLPSASRHLDAEYARSERLGLPMTSAALLRSLPPEQNAALILAPQLSQGGFTDLGSALFDYKSKKMSRAECEQLVELHAGALDHVTATTQPYWQVARSYDQPTFQFPEMQSVLCLGRGLLLRVELNAANPATSKLAVLRDLEAARRVASWIAQEPYAGAVHRAIDLESRALDTYASLASTWSSRPQSRKALLKSLLSSSPHLTSEHAIKGEFYHGLKLARNLGAYGGSKVLLGSERDNPANPNWKWIGDGKPANFVDRAFAEGFMKAFNDAIEPSQTLGWEKARVGEAIDRASMNDNLSGFLLDVSVPVLNVEDDLDELRVKQDLVRILIEQVDAQIQTGHWKAVVDQDPFSAGAYKSASVANAIKIWSVGKDGIDHGGNHRDVVVSVALCASP